MVYSAVVVSAVWFVETVEEDVFSRYFHLLTFYHNILTTEMAQSKWRSLARTGDGFFNKMGATWGQNIDIKKTGVQNINYKLKQLGAEYKVTSKILISILSM